MFEVVLKDDFNSAHRLVDYDGKCENIHGHNWKVEVTICARKLDRAGMVMDFKQVRTVLDGIIAQLDHKYLNDISFFINTNPTAENIAFIIYNRVADGIKKEGVWVKKVRVWETDNCSASYFAD